MKSCGSAYDMQNNRDELEVISRIKIIEERRKISREQIESETKEIKVLNRLVSHASAKYHRHIKDIEEYAHTFKNNPAAQKQMQDVANILLDEVVVLEAALRRVKNIILDRETKIRRF